jgi:hypothetical protein
MRSRVVKRAIAASPTTIKHKRDARQFKAWTVSALLEQYRDPRAILLEIASTPTAELAKQMHGTLADALAERRLCAQAVLPYVAQKLPVQVDMRHTRAINLNIVDERQYKELIEVAATEEQSDGAFSMQLLSGATADETPVTPPTPATPTGEE